MVYREKPTLAKNNSDFGLKFARVLLDGEVHDRKCFWAFYDADAYNYPKQGSNHSLDHFWSA